MDTATLEAKLSAGEFLFGPKKPKMTHGSAQHRADTAKYKEKHAKSVPGRLQKGYKMVFGRKVKVSEAEVRSEWQERFRVAFSTAHLFEGVAGMAFEQALIEEGAITDELLEDVFVGLLEHAGTDDLAVIDEAVDELVEELWLERMERTKAFAKKAASSAGHAAKKTGKEIAKDVGKSLLKHAAGEVEKHLKGAKTKKGTAKHTLKHAARGALKQIAKDPKRAKEIAKKSLTKLAKKGAKHAIKKGLKMVFGKWAKVEATTDDDLGIALEWTEGELDALLEAMAKGKSSFKVPPPKFRHPAGDDDKFAEAERLVSFVRMRHPEFKDIYWDTWQGPTRARAGKSVWIGLRDNRDPEAHSKRLEDLFKILKKMGWTSRRNKSGGRTTSLIARPKTPKKPKKEPEATPTPSSKTSTPADPTKHPPLKPGESTAFEKTGMVKVVMEPDGTYTAMTRAHSKNFKTYDGALIWLRKNARAVMTRYFEKRVKMPSETRPTILRMQGVKGHVLADHERSELRPSLPVSVATGLQAITHLKPDHLAMRQEWEYLATQQLGAPPAGVWTWGIGNEQVEGGPGKLKPKWRGAREWIDELNIDGDTLHESLLGALTEWEAYVDDQGYAHDDEGNKWFVGRSYAGGTYGLGQLPMGDDGGGYKRRRSSYYWGTGPFKAIDKALKMKPNSFLKSIRDQMSKGRRLSDKQKKAVVRIFHGLGMYEEGLLFGGPLVPKEKQRKSGEQTSTPKSKTTEKPTAEPKPKISVKERERRLAILDKALGQKPDSFLKGMRAMVDKNQALTVNQAKKVRYHLHRLGMHDESKLFKEAVA